MVILANGLNVWVSMAGEVAQEYEVTSLQKDGVKSIIEATEGKEFQVHYVNTPFIPGCRTSSKLLIDGKVVDNFGYCNPDAKPSQIKNLRGYREKQTSSVATLRAFTFGPMPTTHEGSPKDVPEEILSGACSIRLDFEIKRRVGDMNHKNATEQQYVMPSTTSVHEDCKPALWGLATKPGQSFTENARNTCFCTMEEKGFQKQTVIFNYRSHAILVAQGNKEATENDQRRMSASFGNEDDDDDVQIDTHRTERTASRRRAREGRMPNTRNVRAKREETVKSEGMVKKEEEGSTQAARITLDLTEDGEGYKVIRPKRETVIIEDDSEGEEN